MITVCSKNNARPSITINAALFEGNSVTYDEETISVKRVWHSNKKRSYYASKKAKHGGDR